MMALRRREARAWAARVLMAATLLASSVSAAQDAPAGLRINEIQFIGSHNSYKKAQPWFWATLLRWLAPETAAALAYEHEPLTAQLDRGLRVLELDAFYDPERGTFPVGHVQLIDMESHCSPLRTCLEQLRAWSDAHPRHLPLWIMFNAKDEPIPRLPDPVRFDGPAFEAFDAVLEDVLGDRMIRPETVLGRRWPSLEAARGKVLFLLDESGRKRALYDTGAARPMFMSLPETDPRAAILVINDPLAEGERIRRLVAAGYMVRTRADADTVEARQGATARREAALASGAQAVSTDYYRPAAAFGQDYVVRLPSVGRCNPVATTRVCQLTESGGRVGP